MGEVSRRSFLKRFPALIAKSAAAFAETLGEGMRSAGDTNEPGKAVDPTVMPAAGAPVEGIPAVHPWITTARTLAEQLGHRVPYILLLGASGEAFRLSYSREDPVEGASHSPINTFLAAIEICGLSAQAAPGGPFAPALGSVEAALGKDLGVVVATDRGPAILLRVDRQAKRVRLAFGGAAPEWVSFADLVTAWAGGAWAGGPAPYLRLTVSPDNSPRPLDDVARAGIKTIITLLDGEFPGPEATGLAAWEAWAGDLRDGKLPPDASEFLAGDFLEMVGVSRMAGGRFLDAVSRATPPDLGDDLDAAARCYMEIHSSAHVGEVWGTGLFPELAECMTTDGHPDPEKLADPAIRTRAADLMLAIRDKEAEALEHLRTLPEEWRTLSEET